MKFLKGVEVVGGFWRIGNFLYADTGYDMFNYSQSVAKRIIWRFYWLTPND